MSAEQLPSSPSEHRKLSELFLPERQKLITKLDTIFEVWAERQDNDTALIKYMPIADLVINDCTPADELDEELARRDMSDNQYAHRRRYFQNRAKEITDIAQQANDQRFDLLKSRSREHNFYFDTHSQWGNADEGGERYTQALTYLRRLFIAREQLALLNGLQYFNVYYLDTVLDELYDDEDTRRSHQK